MEKLSAKWINKRKVLLPENNQPGKEQKERKVEWKMKKNKIRRIVWSLYLLGVLVVAGCGGSSTEEVSEKDYESDDQKTKQDQENQSQAGYVFQIGEIEVAVDMDISLIEEKLGEPDSYFEQPSCAAQGTARIFTYSSFEIDTYPDGEKDLVGSIILKDDNVATAEGIDLSMTKEDILAVYGENGKEEGNSLEYEKDGMKLCFILEEDKIVSIEYRSKVF